MKKFILSFVFAGIVVYMIVFPESSYNAASEAVALCINTILPTLFVFMVCSDFFVSAGVGKIIKKPFSRFMMPLFSIGGAGALALALGLVSGYPVGAKCVYNLYKNRDISKNEAERLLGFCNNCSPGFIIGSVGTAMLVSKDFGYILCGVHIMSAIICGMVLRLFRKEKTQEIINESAQSSVSINLVKAVTDSVKNSIFSILTVCAYTILFSQIISMVYFIFGKNFITYLLGGVIEITNSVGKMALSGESIKMILPWISFMLGFGGMCVHLQTVAIIKNTDLNLKIYIIGKIFHGLVSFVITFALTRLIM